MTTSILAIDRYKIQTQFKDAKEALAYLETLPCSTPAERAAFKEIMDKAHTKSKEFVAERQEITAPPKAQVKEAEDAYRPLIQTLDAMKELARSKVSEYDTRVALEAEASRNLAIAAAQAKDKDACAAALASIPDNLPSSFTWTCGIVNQFDVPREFLEVSTSAVKKYLDAHKNSDTIPSVPGLNFTKKYTVRAK